MIITLLAWFYITAICWSYGNILIKLFNVISGNKPTASYDFSIMCIAGLSLLAIVTGYLSLLTPLGTLAIQLFIAVPAIVIFIYDYRQVIYSIRSTCNRYQYPATFFLLAMLLSMVLIMSVWTINHPDTLGYHAQTIQWIEKYKAVPGLAHLNVRLGYQGLWFVLCAFFSFSFLHLNALTFINSTILVWFIVFAINKINFNLKNQNANKWNSLLYFFLLIISIWSFTQVRLTAISASPDFIAAIYAWTIFYLFSKKVITQTDILLIALLSCTGISIKLAIVPVILFVLYFTVVQLKLKQYKLIFFSLLICCITLLPFLLRNVITSGYWVFPFPKAMVHNVDWTYDEQLTADEKQYIQAYARIPGEYGSHAEVERTNNMPLSKWMPAWWHVKSIADKSVLLLLLVLLGCVLLSGKRLFSSVTMLTAVSVMIAFTGVLFWFINAPDPRFGYGFLIPLTGILMKTLLQQYAIDDVKLKKFLLTGVFTFAIILLAYNTYRVLHFLALKNIVYPSGIKTPQFTSFTCNGITFFVPVNNALFGNIPIPATYDDSCKNFIPRSTRIVDGFKSRNLYP